MGIEGDKKAVNIIPLIPVRQGTTHSGKKWGNVFERNLDDHSRQW